MNKPKIERVPYAPLTLRKDYEDGGDHAAMVWSVIKHSRGSNPRASVYTVNKRTEGQATDYSTIINAPLTYRELMLFIMDMEELLTTTGEHKYEVLCYNTKFENNVRTNEKYLQGTLVVGRDKDDIYYMSVVEEGKRRVKFDFIPPADEFKYHARIVDGETDASIAKYSRRQFEAYLRLMNEIFSAQIRQDIVTEPNNTLGTKTKQQNNTAPEIVEDDIF